MHATWNRNKFYFNLIDVKEWMVSGATKVVEVEFG